MHLPLPRRAAVLLVAFVWSPFAAAIVSDGFQGPVPDPNVWTFVDPLGDGGIAVAGGRLSIGVPAGTSHNLWTTGNDAPRLMQSVADEDFEVEVKFDSSPTQRFQMQGLVVEQDALRYVRLEFHYDGSSVRLYAAVIDGSSASVKANIPLGGVTAPVYLRVARAGAAWTPRYSFDGETWHSATPFSHAMTVTAVGVYAGNYGLGSQPAPAHTTVVDYFADMAAPPAPDPDLHAVTVTTSGAGSVTLDPPGGLYAAGTVLTLTAQPAAGWVFDSWSGALTGGANPATLVVEGAHAVAAAFSATPGEPPAITDIAVDAGANDAVVSWQTDQPTTGAVEYGETTAYELGSVASPQSAASHAVTLNGLAAETVFHFRIIANNTDDLQTISADGTFATTAAASPAPSIVSDLFDTPVPDPQVWTFVNPLGDGQAAIDGGRLLVSLPAGTSHNLWTTGNHSARLMQSVADEDFEVEVKFDSAVTQAFQMQGLLVEQEPGRFVRVEFHHDGTRIRAYAAVIDGGSASVKANVPLTGGSAPMYLRVARAGATWTHRYSFDGETWQTAATFGHAMSVTGVGVYAGNYGVGSPGAPAFTAAIDYFMNLAAPIDPGPQDPQHTLSVVVTGAGTVSKSPDQASYAAGSVVELTAEAAAGWVFDGWSGALAGLANPATLTIVQDALVQAHFVETADPDPDPDPDPPGHALGLTIVGAGSVALDPPGGVYPAGSTVELTATPDADWVFGGWSGALTGADNPRTLAMTADLEVTATFVEAGGGGSLTLNNVQVEHTGPMTARVTWLTNQPATSRVDYGITGSRGAVRAGPPVGTAPLVDIGYLSCERNYLLRVSSAVDAGNQASSGVLGFTSAPCPNPGIGAAPSVEVWDGEVRVVGDRGQSQRWFNVLGRVATAHPLASLSYTLNGGAARALSVGPTPQRLAGKGDFNVEIDYADLPFGLNVVEIRAQDADGRTTTVPVTVTRVVAEPPQLPYVANWGHGGVDTYAYSVDGHWSVQNGRVGVATLDYDRLLVLGDIGWTDYEVTVPILVNELGPHAYVPFSGAPMVGLAIRWLGHTPLGAEQPSAYWYPTGAFAWYRWGVDRFELVGNDDTPFDRHINTQLELGVQYVFKVQALTVDANTTRYRFKFWKAAQSEPQQWQMEITDTGGPSAGAIGLLAHHADARFGNVEVTFPTSP